MEIEGEPYTDDSQSEEGSQEEECHDYRFSIPELSMIDSVPTSGLGRTSTTDELHPQNDLIKNADTNIPGKENEGDGNKEKVMGNETTGVGRAPHGGGNNQQTPNAWEINRTGRLTFAEHIKANNDTEETRLEYIPPQETPEGGKRVMISQDDLRYSAKTFALHLYGYFLGTSLDFYAVNSFLRRLWRNYDLDSISKSAVCFYYFKFKSEEGLKNVLENGPWMVNNVLIFLNKWELGVCLEKVELAMIPLWVTVHNVPFELWTGRGLSKIISGIGIPILMDKVTQERCSNKKGKMGYARVLMDVLASSNLPDSIEIEFPAVNMRPARLSKLDVSYQWKPNVCSHSKVFGHSLRLCKLRPKTDEEIQIEAEKQKKKDEVNNQVVRENDKNARDEDGFTVVRARKENNLGSDQNKKKGNSRTTTGGQRNVSQNGSSNGP
ncbi:hypothetical protein R6Q59_033658 [Mikania micrantha]